jgi:lysophospholipase L1-like esterase
VFKAIWLGANDATIKLPTTSQHVPIEETKENLTAIITHPNVKSHNPKIFVLLPPPVDEIKLTEVDVKNGHETATRRSEVTAKYAQAVREAADTNGVKSIDVFEAITNAAIKIAAPGEYTPGGPVLGSLENGKRGGLESLLTDGLHLSGAGYKVVFDALKRGVGEDWPKQGTEDDRSDYVYPDWRVLNPMEE